MLLDDDDEDEGGVRVGGAARQPPTGGTQPLRCGSRVSGRTTHATSDATAASAALSGWPVGPHATHVALNSM